MTNKPIAVFIDRNAWDYFFERKIDLTLELPKEEFTLCSTSETEQELKSIPATETSVLEYINRMLDQRPIHEDNYFGFDGSGGPFNCSRWQTPLEAECYVQQRNTLGQSPRATGLVKNEADLALAARSFLAVVLTCDKRGPLNFARRHGGKVIQLSTFDTSGMTLREFILTGLEK